MPLGNEETLTVLVLLGVFAAALYIFIRWIVDAPRTPDPWGDETEQALNNEESLPVCDHCLTPQSHNGWFCPHCGATVGPYINYMPFIYVFSQGEVLRAGVTERLRRSPLIIMGFLVFSFGMFAMASIFVLLVPVYWYLLFKNLWREDPPSQAAPMRL